MTKLYALRGWLDVLDALTRPYFLPSRNHNQRLKPAAFAIGKLLKLLGIPLPHQCRRLYTQAPSATTIFAMSIPKAKKPVRSTMAERESLDAGGRERLIAAALRLAAEKRSLLALGVRELGRMAGLNPNTFYRHFKSLDELSIAIIDEFAQDLAPALRAIRMGGQKAETVSKRTVEYVFDYARQHPEAFIVGVRELHGSSSVLQQAIRARIRLVAAEMAEDILAINAIPGITLDMLEELAEPVVEQVFHRTLDYLEEPKRRAELVRRTSHFIDALMTGAVTLKAMNRWD